MLIVGICGKAKSGKDTAADFLVKNNGFVKIAFADPIKRMTAIAYPKMTREHLWGPSEMRNVPLQDYPRDHGPWVEVEGRSGKQRRCACCNVEWSFEDESQCFLTTRYALQQLGTEWGRSCYPNTWVDLALETARCLLQRSGILRSLFYSYTPWDGLITTNTPMGEKPRGVAISDLRWPAGNEGEMIRREGGILLQMLRGVGLAGAAGKHESEKNLEVSRNIFNMNIDNNAMSLEELEEYMTRLAMGWPGQDRRAL
jgi:hypothetical protein